jgi:hypothetical protein
MSASDGMRLAPVLAALLPAPALAEPPMTAGEFAAYVGTDTITYGYSDGTVGIADYGPDHTLRWRYEGEAACVNGRYRQSGNLLCFDFEVQDLAACWSFYRTAGGLHGRGVKEVDGLRIFQINRSALPMSCAEAGA